MNCEKLTNICRFSIKFLTCAISYKPNLKVSQFYKIQLSYSYRLMAFIDIYLKSVKFDKFYGNITIRFI